MNFDILVLITNCKYDYKHLLEPNSSDLGQCTPVLQYSTVQCITVLLYCCIAVLLYCRLRPICSKPAPTSWSWASRRREGAVPTSTSDSTEERELSWQVPRTLLSPTAPHYTYTHRYSFFLLRFFHLWLSIGPLVFSLWPVALLKPSLLPPPFTRALYLLQPITHVVGTILCTYCHSITHEMFCYNPRIFIALIFV